MFDFGELPCGLAGLTICVESGSRRSWSEHGKEQVFMVTSKDELVDALVVGLGLAGCSVVWGLVGRGLDFRVVEAASVECGAGASRVAAGLVTPVTGRRMTVSSMVPLCLPHAQGYYPEVEKMIGRRFWYPIDIVRVFKNADEREALRRMVEAGGEAAFSVGEVHSSQQMREWGMRSADWGGFGMCGGAWLDTAAYLDGTRRWLAERGLLIEGRVEADDLQWQESGVRWGGTVAREIVFCHGLAARDDALWGEWLSFRPAGGDILEVRVDGLAEGRVYNCGGRWLAPRGDGVWRCGASYDFQSPESLERGAARRDLENWLDSVVVGRWGVCGQLYGVRPIIRQSQPVAGRHPFHPRLSILNGLGSRGVLTAPWAAQGLLRHLYAGEELPGLLRYKWREQHGRGGEEGET